MQPTSCRKVYIDERGVDDPVFIDKIKQAADVFTFVHEDGLYEGERRFRASEILAFFNALKHSAVQLTMGNSSDLHDAAWWRKKLMWLADNSESLAEYPKPRGTIGELLLAHLLQDREIVFRLRGFEGTEKAYLPLRLLPPPPVTDARVLVTYQGSGVLCMRAATSKGLENDARRLATESFSAVPKWKWGVKPIKQEYLYP